MPDHRTRALARALTLLALLAGLAAPTAANARVVFQDDFTGTTATWQRHKPAWKRQGCPFMNKQSTGICDTRQPQTDGHGHLIFKAKPTVGAFIGTTLFGGTTWPATPDRIGAAWSVPFTAIVRAKLPADRGWTAPAWMQRVNSATDVAELDFGEETTSRPTTAQSFHHVWHSTTPCPANSACWPDQHHWYLSAKRTDVGPIGGRWHVFAVRASTQRVVYLIDGRTIFVAPGVHGRYAIWMQLVAGLKDSWIAGNNDAPQPWLAPWRPAQMSVDSLKITQP